MRAALRIASAVITTIISASPAVAVDLTSPHIRSTSFGQQIVCTVTNVGTAPIDVRVSTIETSSSGGGTPGTSQLTVPPGGTGAVGTAVTGADDRYCIFSGRFSSKKVRAQIELYDGSGSKLSLPAVK